MPLPPPPAYQWSIYSNSGTRDCMAIAWALKWRIDNLPVNKYSTWSHCIKLRRKQDTEDKFALLQGIGQQPPDWMSYRDHNFRLFPDNCEQWEYQYFSGAYYDFWDNWLRDRYFMRTYVDGGWLEVETFAEFLIPCSRTPYVPGELTV
jgi:hypothetical protein